MKNTINNMIIFVVGTLIGSATTYFVVKKKFETEKENDIKEMREYYTKREEIISEHADKEVDILKQEIESMHQDKKDEESTIDDEELQEYRDIVSQYNHPEYADALVRKRELQMAEEAKKAEEDMTEERQEPFYIIKPDEFGTIDNYELVNLTWYADGILADEFDNIIGEDEIEERIGSEALVDIGKYLPKFIHVRNDDLEVDYEIGEDPRNYCDIYNI